MKTKKILATQKMKIVSTSKIVGGAEDFFVFPADVEDFSIRDFLSFHAQREERIFRLFHWLNFLTQ
jgi:hypothetical protein